VPVKHTVKRVDGTRSFVEATLNRNELWEAQTPQVFRKDVLLNAYAMLEADVQAGVFTDEAAMVEQCGYRVRILRGDYKNIKITTEEDMIIARAFLQEGD